jgi:hypothetical protein
MKQRYLFGAIIASFCLGIALFIPAPSMAEGRCPPGYFPVGGGGAGWEGCAPMGGEPGEGTDTSAPEWETRWGAIATGSGAFGAVENARSKKEAERIAMARCLQSTANARCKIKGSYHDQCVALAWGDKGAISYRGPDELENRQRAMALCSKETTDCQIFYSACSLPARIR